MATSLTNTTALRKNNRSRIFNTIYHAHTALAKQDIAALLHLSLPTVTQNLAELMALGVIEYTGTMCSTGGRKAKAIMLCKDAHLAVGIALSRNHARLLATNLYAEELAYKKIEFSFAANAAADCGRTLGTALEAFITESSLPRERILGVGITVPGIVNVERELVEFAPTLQAKAIAIETFKQNIPYPVYMENDANAGGFAEWWSGRDMANVAYLSIEKGVGGCVLMNGQPYKGNCNRSGEFGHLCIEPHGSLCSCGQRGCLEAYCSTDRLSYDLGITLETFFARLAGQDSEACAMWDDYLNHLAIGINNICMVLDSTVVLGGTLAQYLEPYLDILRDKVLKHSAFSDKAPSIELSRYRSKSTCLGAALHFIVEWLTSM